MRFHLLEEYLRSPFGMKMMGVDKGSADFASLIRSSQKFYVGDVDLLRRIARSQSLADAPRLPYEICALEMEDIDPKGVKRAFFLLAEELRYSDPSMDVIRVHGFCPYAIPRHMSKADLYLHTGYFQGNRATGLYDVFTNKLTAKFLDGGDGFDRLASPDMMKESLLACVEWLFRFLSVLNCSNVEVVEVGAPKFLNRKREKSGKVPVYSYKTLVLKTRQQRLVSTGGSHDAPRVHLRRGHIKRRKTGNFWWEPHVVGDRTRGVVMKDYRADKLLTA